MDKTKNTNEGFTIDLKQIMRALLSRAWLIVIVGVLLAVVAYVYSSYLIAPSYSADVSLYISNRTPSYGTNGVDFSSGDIDASRELVNMYTELLMSRTTLERVIKNSDLDYTHGQLRGMISAGSSNETQVMRIVVTCGDPYEAAEIANSIAEVFPIRVAELIDGASLAIVDSAVPNTQPISPNVTTYTVIGFLLGAMIMVMVISVTVILDDTIHSDEYVSEKYDAPILARIPSLAPASSSSKASRNLNADKFMID